MRRAASTTSSTPSPPNQSRAASAVCASGAAVRFFFPPVSAAAHNRIAAIVVTLLLAGTAISGPARQSMTISACSASGEVTSFVSATRREGASWSIAASTSVERPLCESATTHASRYAALSNRASVAASAEGPIPRRRNGSAASIPTNSELPLPTNSTSRPATAAAKRRAPSDAAMRRQTSGCSRISASKCAPSIRPLPFDELREYPAAEFAQVGARADPVVDLEREDHSAVLGVRDVPRQRADVRERAGLREDVLLRRRAGERRLQRPAHPRDRQIVEDQIAVRPVPVVLEDHHQIARRDAVVDRQAAAVLERERIGVDAELLEPGLLDRDAVLRRARRAVLREPELAQQQLRGEVVAGQ